MRVLCLVMILAALLESSTVCAQSAAGQMSSTSAADFSPPRNKKQRSGRGTWVSVVSFLTAVGWIITNEKDAVRGAYRIRAMLRAAVRSKKASPATRGKLIYTTGQATCEKKLVDRHMIVVTKNPALGLRRISEQYQWREKTVGRKNKVQVHTYVKDWTRKHLRSEKFMQGDGHENLGLRHASYSTYTTNGEVCGFKLPGTLLKTPGALQFEKLEIDWTSEQAKLALAPGEHILGKDGPWLYLRLDKEQRQLAINAKSEEKASEAKKLTPGGINSRSVYIAGNTLKEDDADDDSWRTEPQLGDERVRWEVAYPQTVTAVAEHTQEGGCDSLAAWQGAGTAEFHLKSGQQSLKKLVSALRHSQQSDVWEHRLFGCGSTTMGCFVFCFFMAAPRDLQNMLRYLGGPVGDLLAIMFKPSLESPIAVAGIFGVGVTLASSLIVLSHLFFRLFYGFYYVCGSAPSTDSAPSPSTSDSTTASSVDAPAIKEE